MAPKPRTVEEIFKDYSGRRTALIRALTDEVDKFFELCDPAKDNLCLYGHANGTWEVTEPVDFIPAEIPEPLLGINFVRDHMNRRDWFSLVAMHCDLWLLSVSFYNGSRLNHNERERLFSLINDLPTVFDVVIDKKPIKDKPTEASGSKYRGFIKVNDETKTMQRSGDGRGKSISNFADEDDGDENDETLCGSCGGNYSVYEFWICCDTCDRWFHGKCVKITPKMAESIDQYKCPSCSMHGAGQAID